MNGSSFGNDKPSSVQRGSADSSGGVNFGVDSLWESIECKMTRAQRLLRQGTVSSDSFPDETLGNFLVCGEHLHCTSFDHATHATLRGVITVTCDSRSNM